VKMGGCTFLSYRSRVTCGDHRAIVYVGTAYEGVSAPSQDIYNPSPWQR
jgi:hypothetical protein